MTTTLHIIEPTLANHAGHCHGYIQSLLRANHALGLDLHLWLDWRGKDLFPYDNVTVHPYFHKRWRKIQKWLCLRKLLRQDAAIFIPTAGRLDLISLDNLLSKQASHSAIFLHFHQFTQKPKKIALLNKLAAKYPNWVMMAPTPGLLAIFEQAGFKHCQLLPCPGYDSPIHSHKTNTELHKVLYAGAARSDKGFPAVVEWLATLTPKQQTIPVELQVSPPYSGQYDDASQQAISKLESLAYPQLTLHRDSLTPTAYQALFQGAICLLPYDADAYRDKVSGIALDALLSGSPVVAMADTWAGQVVQRFHAGVVVKDRDPASLQQAITSIFANRQKYQQAAIQAGIILRQEHDPKHTLTTIKQYLVPADA